MAKSPEELNTDSTLTESKRTRRKRLTPSKAISECLKIAECIRDQNNGHPFSRMLIAEGLGSKPDSSSFRDLVTASNQYGLTDGGYTAERLSLTDLGRSVVMPVSEMERDQSLRKVFLNNEIFSRIYQHYSGAKIPDGMLFKNTLIREFSVPAESAQDVVDGFMSNARYVGLVADVAGSARVLTESYLEDSQGALALEKPEFSGDLPPSAPNPETAVQSSTEAATEPASKSQSTAQGPTRIFITHGSNKGIVDQVRQILTFGRYQPVIAEEQQTTAISVPDKVLNSMRSCEGAIIHIENERELLDDAGEKHYVLNPNVLIEIGAAMALYDRSFVLLVKKGVKLPSNLQGLYRCDYDGDQLDFEATMKLLQTFNQFQMQPSTTP